MASSESVFGASIKRARDNLSIDAADREKMLAELRALEVHLRVACTIGNLFKVETFRAGSYGRQLMTTRSREFDVIVQLTPQGAWEHLQPDFANANESGAGVRLNVTYGAASATSSSSIYPQDLLYPCLEPQPSHGHDVCWLRRDRFLANMKEQLRSGLEKQGWKVHNLQGPSVPVSRTVRLADGEAIVFVDIILAMHFPIPAAERQRVSNVFQACLSPNDYQRIFPAACSPLTKWFDKEHLIAKKGAPESQEMVLWKRSYSHAERHLFKHLDLGTDGCRKHCIRVLKYMCSKKQINIKSYVLYCLVLDVMKATDPTFWREANIEACMRRCISRMQEVLRQGTFADALFPSINLLHHFTQERRTEYMARLELVV